MGQCKDNDLTCQYDVAEGVSRAERMKIMKRDSITGELDDLKRIVTSLRSGTDDHATAVLARLRLGESPEDVAKSLPMLAPLNTSGQPPSLLGQDSTDTSGSGMSHESTFDKGKAIQKFRQNSAVSIASPPSQTTAWSPAASISSVSFPATGKGKQSLSGASATDLGWLVPLFDREDYLLAKSLVEGESEEEDDPEERRIDPRLLQRTGTFDLAGIPSSSSNMYSRSQRPSPHRQHNLRSIYPTHLAGRQPIAQAVRVHHNLDVGNIFGNNMSYSNRFMSIRYPGDSQETNSSDFYLPTWAMLPINTMSDPGSMRGVIPNILREATNMINMGRPLEEILEPHPNIAALFDEDVFNNSGILSKWAVGMVHGVYLRGKFSHPASIPFINITRTGNTFTCFGSMYMFWYLMRWMISPSPETYKAMPEWLRPTPNQLFMPHIKIVDFIVWPAFRELAVQIPAMQARMEWLMDMSVTIQCDWGFATAEALVQNDETGNVDLCDKAKETVRSLESWSVGPSFRGYVSNADSYVRIRTSEGY
ncbi:bZIP transcription factor [Pyrenophora seminiperda CCB06]|uniref:BZIP transcription factor n=1 Tax=Pyrenophora seminiperda CCB06 TaxID=1302712 RepID=A0A3M7M1K5_9PLEO|nr:bZIP transcription factor [Pyrenophora seminiperda CCB06]